MQKQPWQTIADSCKSNSIIFYYWFSLDLNLFEKALNSVEHLFFSKKWEKNYLEKCFHAALAWLTRVSNTCASLLSLTMYRLKFLCKIFVKLQSNSIIIKIVGTIFLFIIISPTLYNSLFAKIMKTQTISREYLPMTFLYKKDAC